MFLQERRTTRDRGSRDKQETTASESGEGIISIIRWKKRVTQVILLLTRPFYLHWFLLLLLCQLHSIFVLGLSSLCLCVFDVFPQRSLKSQMGSTSDSRSPIPYINPTTLPKSHVQEAKTRVIINHFGDCRCVLIPFGVYWRLSMCGNSLKFLMLFFIVFCLLVLSVIYFLCPTYTPINTQCT